MTQQAQVKTFPCPGCGSMLEYDPGPGQLHCPSCGNNVPIPTDHAAVIMEYPLEQAEAMASTNWVSDTTTITCSGCGTQSVVPADSGTAECPFCGSKTLVRDDAARTIRPESLIPFKLDHKQAGEMFRAWISKKWFAPREARAIRRSDKLHGVYVPYWTYDSQTDYNWSAEAGTYYYVTEWRTTTGPDGKPRRESVQVRKTSWRPVFGHGNRFFNDVPINASNNENRRNMMKLDFQFDQLVPYRPEFLLGFLAERYSVSVMDGFNQACEVMQAALRQDVRHAIVADEVRNIHVDTRFLDVRFKHLLAPIWISAFGFRGKTYRFVINGQNGEVAGSYPVSPWKVLLVVLLGLAILTGLFFLLEMNG